MLNFSVSASVSLWKQAVWMQALWEQFPNVWVADADPSCDVAMSLLFPVWKKKKQKKFIYYLFEMRMSWNAYVISI